MKIFSFLKKEKADIDIVDRKLEKFERIFKGTVEMSKAAKMEFELLCQRITEVTTKMSSLHLDPFFSICIDEHRVKAQVNVLGNLTEILNHFLEEYDLSPIVTLLDSFIMRRHTIQANCGIMEEKLDEDYKSFETLNQRYSKEAVSLRDSFLHFAEHYQNPKVYYDVSHMYRTLQDLKHRLAQVTIYETEVIDQIKDVNSKVYALVTLFNNSIKELTQNTIQSKKIVLELLRKGSEGLKNLSVRINKAAKDFEPEHIFLKSSMDSFFTGFYHSLNIHLGLINQDASEEQLTKEREKIELMDQLTSGLLIPNDKLLQLAEHLSQRLEKAFLKIADHDSAVNEYVSRFTETVNVLRCFDGQFTALKSSLQASSDSDEFFKILYANYNTEMNFVMKNYFTFFDILQKGLRKAFKTSIDADIYTFEKRMISKMEKLKDKCKQAAQQTQILKDMAAEIRSKDEPELSLYVALANSIKDIDKEMHGLLVVLFQENEVFLQEPLQFLQRSLRALDKVFVEIAEHADIEHSFLSVIDDSEDGMLVTLKSDASIKILFEKKVDVDIMNQLVFNSEHNIQQLYTTFNAVHNDWTKDIGGFLKPESILKNTNFDRLREKGAINTGQVRRLPLEVELYLDLSEDDLNMCARHCYDTRINRKNIPFSGSLLLMNNYLVSTPSHSQALCTCLFLLM